MAESYDNWDDLITAAQAKLKNILEKDVAPKTKEILLKHIETDIYSVYEPKENGWVHGTTYQRRHVMESSIVHLFTASDEITVTSTATASPSVVKGYSFRNRYPGAFLKLLENGDMGIWKNGFPRPAVSNAQKEIDNSGAIKAAIESGLRREFGG